MLATAPRTNATSDEATGSENKKQFKINVKELCRERLEDFKVPVKVAFIEDDLFGERYKKKRI